MFESHAWERQKQEPTPPPSAAPPPPPVRRAPRELPPPAAAIMDFPDLGAAVEAPKRERMPPRKKQGSAAGGERGPKSSRHSPSTAWLLRTLMTGLGPAFACFLRGLGRTFAALAAVPHFRRLMCLASSFLWHVGGGHGIVKGRSHTPLDKIYYGVTDSHQGIKEACLGRYASEFAVRRLEFPESQEISRTDSLK